MQLTRKQRYAALAALLLVWVLRPATAGVVHGQPAGPRVLTGTVPAAVTTGAARLLGPHPAQSTIDLAVGLPLRDESDLIAFDDAAGTPGNPQFRHYLTPDEFNQHYAPTPDQEAQVVSWLTGAGLTITRTYPNHLLVDARGSVAQIELLFHVVINDYQATAEGHTVIFYAPNRNPTVSASVASLVQTVTGLTNYPYIKPRNNGTRHGSTPYYPQDFADAYDVNPLWNAGFTGSGQHIAVTLWDAPPSDSTLQTWASVTGANVATRANGRLRVIPVDGGSAGSSTDVEAAIDTESASGMAPGAVIDFYVAPADIYDNPTDKGLEDVLNIAGTDGIFNQEITSSWGPANCGGAWDAPFAQASYNIYAANTATGHDYLFASGDAGSCPPSSSEYQPSEPLVTLVGGSTFLRSVNGTYPGEEVWGCGANCGSGGGYSTHYSRPSWQTGPGLTNNGERGYPDIAMEGDPNTGAFICSGGTSCTPSDGDIWGGTSLSSPLLAGALADVDQYLQAHTGSGTGFFNPSIYYLFTHPETYAPYHDITTGNDGYYPTGPGWDPTTGVGTPDVWNLARDLAGISTAPTPTPTSTPRATPTGTLTPTPTILPTSGTLTNGGFENGQSPWTWSSWTGDSPITTSQAYAGTHSAQFCGKMSCLDVLTQTITLPSTFTAATLSYMVKGQTNNHYHCDDFLTTQIKTGTGSLITTPGRLCNISSGWLARSIIVTTSLLPYAGKQVQVSFVAQTGSADLTSYWLDDVNLTLSGTGAHPTATPTSTARPTATSTPRPTTTSTPKPTATGTPRPTATSTPKPTATSTPRPTATSTPRPTNTPTPTSTPTSGSCSTTSTCLQSMLSLLNSDRAASGVGPLSLNMTETNGTSTCVGSYGHSVHMAQIGRAVSDQFPADICFSAAVAVENVGKANTSSEWGDLEQLDAAMIAEPHSLGCTGNQACNIIRANVHHVGIGIYRDASGTTWLTEDFTN